MRRGIALVLALCGLAVAAPAAQATFHLVKIREIGQGGASFGDYVVLQAYAPGQNLVANKFIQTYQADGTVQDTFTFPSNVGSGADQRTIYVQRNEGTPPVTPDFTTPDLVLTNDGAVCYGSGFAMDAAIDCVAYGAFTGFAGPIPSPVGTPAPAPGAGQAIVRSIARGCATKLESGDDTNDSSADFAIGPQAPRNNATAPTEMDCVSADNNPPQTTITKKPKRHTTKRKAKISFQSNEPGSSFMCQLDGGYFNPCDSPFKSRIGLGKHRFAVFAVDAAGNRDTSPAKVKFKRVRKR